MARPRLVRTLIGRCVSAYATSPALRTLQREKSAAIRRVTFARPLVRYFHQGDDPYSQLTAQIVPELSARYAIDLETHVVPAPSASAAPEAARLAAYAERDAALLARAHGLRMPLAAQISDGDQQALASGERLRARLGHYLGATFYFEGEWYWGLDRLPYLEARLAPFRRQSAVPIVAWKSEGLLPPAKSGTVIDFFASLRSPYTYLAAARIYSLAERFGASVRLRFVLPMVMRGLPVPWAKRLYIMRDTKREAERLAMPFGNIADPVGRGVERGLAVLHYADARGKGAAFLQSFLSGAFSQAIDAATDAGLGHMASRAGLNSDDIKAALGDSSWREVAEKNRAALFALGLWGVPSFRIQNGPNFWGQDRLWAIEEALSLTA